MSRTCATCGWVANEKSLFCGVCGQPMGPTSSTSTTAGATPLEQLPPPLASQRLAPPPPDRGSLPPPPGSAPMGASTGSGLGKLLAGIALAAIVVGGAIFGYTWLKENYVKPKDLHAGDCLSSIPYVSNMSADKVSCSSPSATYKVLSNVKATGSSYPGNIYALESSCESSGGTAVPPAQSAWDDGDHYVLCYDRVRSGSSPYGF